jgi:hypothetical protein
VTSLAEPSLHGTVLHAACSDMSKNAFGGPFPAITALTKLGFVYAFSRVRCVPSVCADTMRSAVHSSPTNSVASCPLASPY